MEKRLPLSLEKDRTMTEWTGPIRLTRALFMITTVLLAFSAGSPRADDDALTASDRQEVIENLAGQLRENYIFLDVAENLAAILEKKNRNGDFRDFADPRGLAGALTDVMREETGDLHFAAMYDRNFPAEFVEEGEEEGEEGGESPGESDPERGERLRRMNYGFEKIERLKGNVGYLDLRMFAKPAYAAETAVAAMNYLAGSDALIIDLRQNGGGSPGMIQLILSYLYDGDPIHFNSFYNRSQDSRKQFWTLPYVPGKKMADVELYVLISGFTGSAAEEFAYDIQTLERGTLIGRTTAGAAHPGGMFPLGNHMAAFISTGRAINPVTGTDWEGVGVKPDVDMPEEEALEHAHTLALRHILETSTDPAHRADLEWEISSMEAAANPLTLSEAEMARLTGAYGPRSIRKTAEGLVYQREGGPAFSLIPLSDRTFLLGADGEAKVEFTFADDGEVNGFKLIFKNGREMVQPRTG